MIERVYIELWSASSSLSFARRQTNAKQIVSLVAVAHQSVFQNLHHVYMYSDRLPYVRSISFDDLLIGSHIRMPRPAIE